MYIGTCTVVCGSVTVRIFLYTVDSTEKFNMRKINCPLHEVNYYRQSKCPFYGIVECLLPRGLFINVLIEASLRRSDRVFYIRQLYRKCPQLRGVH